MPKHGKRLREARKAVEPRPYDLSEAIRLLKSLPGPNFDQSVELHLRLGIDPKQSDQNIRGAVSLPAGLGRPRRVVAFCPDEMADAAKEAGAVEAGADDLIAKVQDGWMDFDVAVAHPQMMSSVAKLGRILGPQGKMPTPKAGTVGEDIPTLVSEFKAGKLEYRNDSGGNLHAVVGKMSFDEADLARNIRALADHLKRLRPTSAKGRFFRRACLSATMMPSVELDLSSLGAPAVAEA